MVSYNALAHRFKLARKTIPKPIPIPEIVDCRITIQGTQGYIEGKYPLSIVRNATSYYMDGFQYTDAFRRHVWDGKKHFFNLSKSSMPSGLVHLVIDALKEYSPTAKIEVIDNRNVNCPPIAGNGFDLLGIEFGKGIFDYQLEAVKKMVEEKRGILKIATNGGKCLDPETPIIKLNGSIVKARNVKVGDELMGPDRTPRNVLSTCTGMDHMFRIIPKKNGEPFECNSVHVLTIFDPKKQEIVDVPLNEFFTWGRESSKLIRSYSKDQIEFTGFSIENRGLGSYAGFTLDGDGRFLLGDFTVTHNTECAAALIKHLGLPTLFLVERLDLLYQARKRFSIRLGILEEEIGLIGDGGFSVGKWITVSTPTSLKSHIGTPEIQFMLNKWDVLICDEAHHLAADTFFEVVGNIPSFWRFGLSGTPLDRSDGADMKLLAQTGPVIYEVSNKLLVERGISVPPHVEMIKITDPVLPLSGMGWREVHTKGIVENTTLNDTVVTKAIEHSQNNKQVLILVEQIKHGDIIYKKLYASKCKNFEFITGKESTDTRTQALDDFKIGKIRILIATSILDEGIDVPNIDVLILAAGGKAKIRLLQRAGRGLRTNAGKDKLLIIDFAIFCHKWLLKHSMTRLKTYRNEECFLISAS